MTFNRFHSNVLIRYVLILVNLVILAGLIQYDNRFFSLFVASAFVIVQLISLFAFLTKSNREIFYFAESLKQSDFSLNYKARKNPYFKELDILFFEIINIIKESTIKKEAHYQYLLTMLEEVNTGILAINSDNKVEFQNKAAKDILRTDTIFNLENLQHIYPGLYSFICELNEGNSRMYELDTVEGKRVLSIRLNRMKILGEEKQVFSFHDIKGEVEESEYEAWNKVIRMLSHEIMNSISPIVSLAETGASILEGNDGSIIKKEEINSKLLTKIHQAFETIENRGQGLHRFVEDFRKFTRVPDPVFKEISITKLINRCLNVLNDRIVNQKVNVTIFDDKFDIVGDNNLLDQVFINLIKNSLDALQNSSKPAITILAKKDNHKLYITINDNGPGIPTEKQKLIFIPFYSTKDSGSGIGLSLSKQIMQKHGGDLLLESQEGEFTRVSLEFKMS